MYKILSSFIISLSFISIIPIPQKFIPVWNSQNLRYFCLMLPVVGIIFSLSWLTFWQVLSLMQTLSPIFRGFLMTCLTLGLTGGLHLDGLMDSCDAIFSHRDRQTRLQILSDTACKYSLTLTQEVSPSSAVCSSSWPRPCCLPRCSR